MRTNYINAACDSVGYCILTENTTDPAVVLKRLLTALRVLSPEAHADADAAALSIPSEALADEGHAWWSSAAADAVMHTIGLALNAHAPKGFALDARGDWLRLGFFPLPEDLLPISGSRYTQEMAPGGFSPGCQDGQGRFGDWPCSSPISGRVEA
jgi:hypothetical protein